MIKPMQANLEAPHHGVQIFHTSAASTLLNYLERPGDIVDSAL